ncbi:MAG: hypothetical protein M3O31_01930 [Acidobacteriota bacterium]|nr:hypothetical protein [Acidobacteriota bacterium]
MANDFTAVFEALKGVLKKNAGNLAVKADTTSDYSVTGHVASPFPQHKGRPMWFAAVRVGKAYVSFHLMPVYMNPALNEAISPELKKRMQGKACFNFKKEPDAALLKDLAVLTRAAVRDWKAKKWL